MKLSEIRFMPETLTLLFKHFRDNSIHSAIAEVESYASLFDLITGSEYLRHSYIEPVNTYDITFTLPDGIDINNVWYFLFDNGRKEESSSLLIDLFKAPGESFIQFEFAFEKRPPFVTGLMDENYQIIYSGYDEKELVDVTESEIISFEEFTLFLSRNSSPGEIIWIGVE